MAVNKENSETVEWMVDYGTERHGGAAFKTPAN